MNAEQLLAHYDRVADAPDAVERLRRLVLDLAVRGKLVPQSTNDRCHKNELAAARTWLAQEAQKTGRVRWKASEDFGAHEESKSLPHGWVAARVNDTGLYINGLAFKPADWKSEGLPIVRIQNLTDSSKEFNYAQGDYPDEVIVRDGDILVSWSATLEAFRWTRGRGVLNQHIFRVIPAPGLTTDAYLLLLLRNAIRDMAESEHAHGLVMRHINRGPFTAHLVQIPPLAEQHRIVAKVDELMALCDRLEAARAQRETTRDRLTTATLARLNTSESPASPDNDAAKASSFQSDARFALKILPALTARPDQIKQLRQTILRLAVRGGLSSAGDWKYQSIRLGDAASLQNGYAFKSEWFTKNGVRLLRNANVSHGTLNWMDEVCLSEAQAAEYERFRLAAGDVVVSLDRPFIVTGTKVARVTGEDLPALLLQRVGRFVLSSSLSADYLFLWVSSPEFSDQIDPGRSNGVPHISSKQVEGAKLLIPPLTEQHRIVAKVDELMSLCDQLEASLIRGENIRSRLLDALLHEALAPTEPELEAA